MVDIYNPPGEPTNLPEAPSNPEVSETGEIFSDLLSQNLLTEAEASEPEEVASVDVDFSEEPTSSLLQRIKREKDVFKNSFLDTYRDWKADESRLNQARRLVVGSFAWANLIFGEATALYIQGLAQTNGASDMRSFAIGVGSALAVETAFTMPLAARYSQPQPKEVVAEAMATSFWLGGAMGVENKKLPLSQAPAAIGAYMIFGTALAALGEYNNMAANVVSQKEVIIPTLLAYAVVKKRNELVDHKDILDRMADRTVRGVSRAMRRRSHQPEAVEADINR